MSKKTRGRYVAAKNTGGSKMKKYAFGIDVGGTTCKIGFFETNGKLIDKWEIKTNTENNGAAILSDIAQAVDNKLAQEGISKDDVQGVGIGVPGPVKSNGVVNRCVNLGWGIVNVEEELGNLTGLKVKAGNDANVAALGEMWQGAAKGCKDVIMVTLGTGTGIYSLLVGFFLSLICIVIVSLCTKAPNEEMQKEFADVADKSIEL